MPASPTLWLTGLAHAKAFRKAHGHLAVPHDWRTEDNYPLGKWIANRRQEAVAGKLAPDRHAALSRLGMVWTPHQAQWEKGLKAAAAYAARFGHLDVPQTFCTRAGFHLGRWLTSRRLECRQGRLAPEKVAALEALGILWEPRAQAWDEAFRQAQAYWRQHRNLLIPHDWRTEDGLELGSWVQVQRREFRAGKLAPERVAALEALRMVWDGRDKPAKTKALPGAAQALGSRLAKTTPTLRSTSTTASKTRK